MFKLAGKMTVALALAFAGAAPVVAQETHEVRLQAEGRDEYRFAPGTVSAKPGDALVFILVSGAPHSVVFEGRGLPPAAREALNAAMPRRSGDLSSPLLTENGAEYRITVPALPPGEYRFYCLPHRAYDMRGVLLVM